MAFTNQEKGLSLELRLARLFESQGYQVTHNVQKKGRSGVSHQIDVLAEYRAPLHTSRVIIEAKSYTGSIDKDQVMKLIQIVEDLGADRGILVTTSSFTPSAVLTAQGHNVELWDRTHLAELIGEADVSTTTQGPVVTRATAMRVSQPADVTGARGVQPRLSHSDAHRKVIQAVASRGAGFLGLGRVKEEIAHFDLHHYPFYEVSLEYALESYERRGLSKVKTEKYVPVELSIDAMTGELVTVVKEIVSRPFTYLWGLGPDELGVLQLLAGRQSADERLATLSQTPSRWQKSLDILLSRGLVQSVPTPNGQTTLRIVRGVPDPATLRSLSLAFEIGPLNAPPNVPASDRVETAAVIRTLESAWYKAHVRTLQNLYYPLYVAMLRRPDGSRRIEVLDGVTGLISEDWSKRLHPLT